MLFKRRATPPWHAKARSWVWPTRSFSRSWQYLKKRVLRVDATPYAIAMGVACGAFISFTPLLGLHILGACLLAYAMRANVLAALLGTAVGNPITFPFIWALTFRVGRVMLGEPVHHRAAPNVDAPSDYSFDALARFIEAAWPFAKPMFVGSIPLGLTAAFLCYVLTYGAVVGYQSARKARLHTARERKANRAKQTRADEPLNTP